MRIFRSLKTAAVLLSVGGLGFGLIGSGVRAAMTDGGSATENIAVGSLHCAVTSTDPSAVVTGNSVTLTSPPILSSSAGYRYVSDVTVTNTGTLPETVHWTFTEGGTLTPGQWSGGGVDALGNPGTMGYTTGTVSLNMTTDIVLPAGGHQTYGAGGNGIGFIWGPLDNTYLGQTASITYTANCGEQPASQISFVGAADAAIAGGTAPKASSVACPTGSPAAGYYPWVSSNTAQWCGNNTFPVSASLASWPATGSFTVTASGGVATVTYTGRTTTAPYEFTGLTNTSSATGSVAPGSNNVVGVLAPTALPLPSGWQVGDMAIAVDYGSGRGNPAGFTGLWNTFSIYGPSDLSWKVLATGDNTITMPAGKGTAIAVFVYHGVAAIGASGWAGGGTYATSPALTLAKPDGSSWVVSLDAASASVSGVNYAGLSNRSSGLAGTHVGAADTNKGVATWPGEVSTTPASGDNYAVELESK